MANMLSSNFPETLHRVLLFPVGPPLQVKRVRGGAKRSFGLGQPLRHVAIAERGGFEIAPAYRTKALGCGGDGGLRCVSSTAGELCGGRGAPRVAAIAHRS